MTSLLGLLLFLPSAKAQRYEDFFEDATLRVDYVFAGNAKEQHIYLDQLMKQDKWAGRKSRLDEIFLRGNGHLTVRDHTSQQVIYTWSFSTLFQEWLQYDEATKVSKAFDTSYNIPFPKKPIDITVTLTDNRNKVTTEMTHTVDPTDILIRPYRRQRHTFPLHLEGKGQHLRYTSCSC